MFRLFKVAIPFACFFLLAGLEVKAETIPPLTTTTTLPGSANGSNGWFVTPVEVTLSGTDLDSGVRSINWKLNDGGWNVQTFDGTVNLVSNPSFEEMGVPPITGWQFAGQPSSQGSRDSSVSQFGLAAAKISSSENGWSGFNNQLNYLPVSPFANMNLSFWLKTQSVQGNGAYVKIYVLSPSGSILVATSDNSWGSSDWRRLDRNFYVSVNDAYGLYFDLGIDGTGTVWYDGVYATSSPTDTRINQTFSVNGSNQLEFYAVDNDGNEEIPHSFLALPVDTVSPTNWREFSVETAGNDHTLKTEIRVDDLTSMIDSTTGRFQYSVDGGASWGYYSDLLSCSSTWNEGLWRDLTVETENGGWTAELKTPAVDFCNSNWDVCKIVRFSIGDRAGNSSTKEICLYGTWFRATGDVGSRSAITMTAAGTAENSDGVIFSASTIENFTSANGWYLTNYLSPSPSDYADWYVQFPTTSILPAGKLPLSSGLYLVNSSFTISRATIPSNFETSTFSDVIYVNGDLTINSDLRLSSASTLAFIVAGDVRIDKNVTRLDSFLLADGEIDVSYNGNSGEALVVNGSLVAETLSLKRSPRGHENTLGVDIVFQPKYWLGLRNYLGSGKVWWKERAP